MFSFFKYLEIWMWSNLKLLVYDSFFSVLNGDNILVGVGIWLRNYFFFN